MEGRTALRRFYRAQMDTPVEFVDTPTTCNLSTLREDSYFLDGESFGAESFGMELDVSALMEGMTEAVAPVPQDNRVSIRKKGSFIVSHYIIY